MVKKLLPWVISLIIASKFGDVVVLLAEWINPVFGKALPVELIRGTAAESSKSNWQYWLALLVSTLLIWAFIQVTLLVISLVSPASARFGATKPLRRFQGLGAEILLLTFFVAAITLYKSAEGIATSEIVDEMAQRITLKVQDDALAPLQTSERSRYEASTKEREQYQSVFGPVVEGQRAYMTELRENLGWLPGDPGHPGEPVYQPYLYQQLVPRECNFCKTVEESRAWDRAWVYNVGVKFGPKDRLIEQLTAEANNRLPSVTAAQEAYDRARAARESLESEFNSQGYRHERVQDEAKRRLSSSSPLWWYLRTLSITWPDTLTIAIPLYLVFTLLAKPFLSAIHNPVRRFLDAGKFGFGGSARLATLLEEWPLRWKRGRGDLFMGRSLYSRFLHLSLKDDRHMLTIAGSRGGKGTTAIIPNLLLWEGSALVIDPKGTNAAVTAARRIEMGHSVHIIDPFDVLKSGGTAAFNPLGMLDPDSREIREQISVIAEAIVVPDPDPKQKHWDDGARTVLTGLIAHLITNYTEPTLPQLRHLLSSNEEEQIKLWADMSLNQGAGGAAREAANRIIRGIGTDEMAGILSNVDKHTEWLASGPIQDTLSRTTFAFAEMKETPTTIYLILPPHYLDTHNRFLRLFVNLAIKQMSVGGRSNVPVLMILDEFLALGHMAEVEKAMGLMAGYNFILWPFVQDLGRLKDLYKNSVNAFINNSRAVQVFAISDEATTKFVSDRLGERSMNGVLNLGQASRIVPLRTPTEVAKEISAESNCQYILRAGKPPLIIEKVRYFEDSSTDASLPSWPMRRLFPFWKSYGKDPDYN